MRRAAVVTAAALLALAGCGSAEKQALLSRADKQGLLTRIALIRESAAAGDLATTQRRLRGFRRAVIKLEQAGKLDEARARALELGAARALGRAPTDVHTPAPVTTPAPAPAPTPTPSLPPGQAKDKRGKDGADLPPGQAKKEKKGKDEGD